MIPSPDAYTRSNYRVGEDVIVRLAGVDVFDVERGGLIPALFLPFWTIATITGTARSERRDAYVVHFRLCHSVCVCTVHEDAIDGTA